MHSFLCPKNVLKMSHKCLKLYDNIILTGKNVPFCGFLFVMHFFNEVINLGKAIDKKIIKELYLRGHNSVEISIIVNKKAEAVKKYIQRNFSDLKLEHKRVRYRNKQIEKSINIEAIKYMSDESFIKKNPSIYSTTLDGDIVVNAPGYTLPWDVPKGYKNDNSTKLVNRRILHSNYRKDELFG